jgi:hypothetical protein
MRYFVHKTNSFDPYGWDWQTKLTIAGDGWGPVRANRAQPRPGDVIITYDLSRKLVYAVSIFAGPQGPDGFHWDGYFGNDGELREGWYTNSLLIAVSPVVPTDAELAAVKGAKGHEIITFKQLPDDIGLALYERICETGVAAVREAFHASLNAA